MNNSGNNAVWNNRAGTQKGNGAKGRLWILQRSKNSHVQNRSLETLLVKKSCTLEKRPGLPRTLRSVSL